MKKIINAHRFFVDMTPEYVGKFDGVDWFNFPVYKLKLKDIFYYPVAYCKFMYLSLKS